LLCTQAVGEIKHLHGEEVYVKKESCEAALKEIFNHLKRDSNTKPEVRKMLGEWQFFMTDLVPLIIVHRQDLRITFYVLIIMVLLTQQPKEECEYTQAIQTHLKNYK